MTIEKFEHGILLKRRIAVLEREMINFATTCVHIRTYDHYGNKTNELIKTYMFGEEYNDAAGLGLETEIRSAYKSFLSASRRAIQNRINVLQLEFDNL